MSLSTGTRLGPYEIVAPLGAGGMGEVYRARDTQLKRDVALKVLPAAFTNDADRLVRFQREAEVLAALNHPHIAAIYGLERTEATTALVLELVEGETLADRIARGPIPFDEAIPIARQIADALESAHDRGIIHRDLKPANIKVRPDGTIKVLDFGLAKALDAEGDGSAEGAHGASLSPTMTSPAMTRLGIILGTAAYMSPEQARGRPADRRSDVWAFGCVLYETLTGSSIFGSEEVSDTLAAVLRAEPDWNALPADTPPRIRLLLQRCLRKDPRQRLPHIGAARVELDDAIGSPHSAAPSGDVPPSSRRAPLTRWWAAGLAAAALAGAVIAGAVVWQLTSRAPDSRRYVYHLGSESFTRTGRHIVSVSGAARRVAYVADSQIYLLNADDPVARPIAGTAVDPIFPALAPDGESIAFFAAGEIRRIPVGGGTAVPLTQATVEYGMSWETGAIVYAQRDGIWRVPDIGGMAELLVKAADTERMHAPQLLPDGKSMLFTVAVLGLEGSGRDAWDDAPIVVQSIRGGPRKVVARGAYPRYLPSGHLVYVSGSTLFARRFDLAKLEATGTAVPVQTGIERAVGPPTGIAQYAISDQGTLAYISGNVDDEVDLVVIDRSDRTRVLPNSTGASSFPRISPDGTRIAVQRGRTARANIWIYDIPRTQWRQLTTAGGSKPVWQRNGQTITFLRGDELWNVPADGGSEQQLPGTKVTNNRGPDDWAPSDAGLLYTSPAGIHLFSARLGSGSLIFPAPPGGSAGFSRFSPDGRAIAFVRIENPLDPYVYLTPYPVRPGAERKVTNEIAVAPAWSRSTKPGAPLELYVAGSGALHARQVTETAPPAWLNPVLLFPANPRRAFSEGGNANYDAMPTGEILATAVHEAAVPAADAHQTIEIVLNWTRDLTRLVP
jgi:eukaryotic-like serine/threonine-protein kinase